MSQLNRGWCIICLAIVCAPMIVSQAAKGKEIGAVASGAQSLGCLAVSRDGTQIATEGSDKTIVVWNRESLQPAVTLPVRRSERGSIWSIAFSPDGRFLAACGAMPKIRVWETKKWAECAVLPTTNGSCGNLAFTGDSKRLIADGIVWNVEAWQREHAFFSEPRLVGSVAIQHDGSIAAMSTGNIVDAPLSVELWNLDTYRSMLTVTQVWSNGHELAFSTDGRLLACPSSSHSPDSLPKVTVHDVPSGRMVAKSDLPLPGDLIATMFAPKGNVVACGGRFLRKADIGTNKFQGQVYFLNGQIGAVIGMFEAHSWGVGGLGFANATTLVTGGTDGLIKVWNVAKYVEPQPLDASDLCSSPSKP